jgi:flagellar hook-associated protein 1
MMQLAIGATALQTAQRALNIAGNNIANANTPGYHRQIPTLASVPAMQIDGLPIGRGVELTEIIRAVNDELEAVLTEQFTQNGSSATRLTVMTRMESRWSTDEASPVGRLEALFNNLEQLSSRLQDGASRRVITATAAATAREFNSLANDMYRLREEMDRSIRTTINEVNPLVHRIADLNRQIQRVVGQGVKPNDLLDRRGQLVNELAQRMPIELHKGNQDQITILSDGIPLVIGGTAHEVAMTVNENSEIAVEVIDTDTPFRVQGGRLGALLELRNTGIKAYHDKLDTLARDVVRNFDAVHSTGVGPDGGFSQLNSQRNVTDVNQPLNAAGLAFPPQAGSLFVTMTNKATGEKTITEIAIDPATQSLADVANSLNSSVPNLSAFASDQVGRLSLIAANGYQFNFTGGIDPQITSNLVGGSTTTATASGVFTGTTNDTYNVSFIGSGTIGVTPGLQMRVTNQAGDILATVNVGEGYEAGQPISLASGAKIALSPGTAEAGDSFSMRVIGQPDSAGLLTALGLNTFFSGDDAATMTVNEELLSNPDRLATSKTGQPGDSSNLQRLIALRDFQGLNNGTATFTEQFHQTLGEIGSDVSFLKQLEETNQLLTDRVGEEIQSVSGVDPNEEMVEVLKYQRMFQMAAKYINVVNETLDQLLQLA